MADFSVVADVLGGFTGIIIMGLFALVAGGAIIVLHFSGILVRRPIKCKIWVEKGNS